jgi:hypothetical protein
VNVYGPRTQRFQEQNGLIRRNLAECWRDAFETIKNERLAPILHHGVQLACAPGQSAALMREVDLGSFGDPRNNFTSFTLTASSGQSTRP